MIVQELPIDSVRPNPDQPRKLFEIKDLESLAASIVEHGQLQPIRVRIDGDGLYTIVLGERRWRAHKLLGRTTIHATVVDVSDDQLADQAIVENLQRRDITPLEEARAFQARLDAGLTVDELAKRLGLKQPWRITERTSLLKLDPTFQGALEKGILTPSQAFEMSRLDPDRQRRLFDAIGAGKCKTYEELRRVTQALYDEGRQGGMFDEKPPCKDDVDTARRLEKKIDAVCAIVRDGFDENEVVVLRKVNPLRASVLADELFLIEKAVKAMRLALLASSVTRKAS